MKIRNVYIVKRLQVNTRPNVLELYMNSICVCVVELYKQLEQEYVHEKYYIGCFVDGQTITMASFTCVHTHP